MNKLTNYSTPEMEIIELHPEQGFAASVEDYNGFGTEEKWDF